MCVHDPPSCPPGMQKEVALLVEVLNSAKGPYSHYARNLKKLLDGLGVSLVTAVTVTLVTVMTVIIFTLVDGTFVLVTVTFVTLVIVAMMAMSLMTVTWMTW